GISSFKIEGRIRPPEYVKTTVSCYRRAIDAVNSGEFTQKLALALKDELKKAYNRGFSQGFYKGLENGWISEGPAVRESKEYLGEAVNYYKKVSVAEFLIRSKSLNVGDKILVYGKTTPAEYSVVDEIQVNHESVLSVSKGERCGIKLPFVVRPGDKLFLVKDSVE
ncbi:MAG: U32 family peptidase, partial [Methanomicrobium sp.]|nr:U32 family peptidase [Methanomicrobium sp.]